MQESVRGLNGSTRSLSMRDGWLFTWFEFDLLTANEMGREGKALYTLYPLLPGVGQYLRTCFLATYHTGRRKLSIELFILGQKDQ